MTPKRSKPTLAFKLTEDGRRAIAASVEGALVARCLGICGAEAEPTREEIATYLSDGWPETCVACGGGIQIDAKPEPS